MGYTNAQGTYRELVKAADEGVAFAWYVRLAIDSLAPSPKTNTDTYILSGTVETSPTRTTGTLAS